MSQPRYELDDDDAIVLRKEVPSSFGGPIVIETTRKGIVLVNGVRVEKAAGAPDHLGSASGGVPYRLTREAL
jgi:hypothetical protein